MKTKLFLLLAAFAGLVSTGCASHRHTYTEVVYRPAPVEQPAPVVQPQPALSVPRATVYYQYRVGANGQGWYWWNYDREVWVWCYDQAHPTGRY